MDLYETTIKRLIDSDRMSRSDKVLAVCAGGVDAKVLRSCGCSDITISNLAERWDMEGVEWMHQDAEALTIPDGSFDWTIVHAGLHHCASPHRALLEMYRVSRKGVIVFEARDSAFMRLAIRLGLVPQFELEAVVLEGWESGGVRNSAVPNYIYRWTEREVRKTMESAYPQFVHEIQFEYGLSFPEDRIALTPLRHIAWALRAMAKLVHAILPRQGNSFAFVIFRTDKTKPWLDDSGLRMRRDYKLGFRAPSRE